MFIKRNIKKIKGDSNRNKFQSPKLRSTGRGKYVFPKYPYIPAGKYFSKITDARRIITQSNRDAIEVFYEIKNATICYQIANGILPEDTEIETYYIKQVYPIGTQYYEDFIDSVDEFLEIGGDMFGLEDAIGVTELVSLAYSNSNVGGFHGRCPFEMDDFIRQDIEDTDDDY